MVLLGKLPSGSGVLVANQPPVQIPIPAQYAGGSVSVRLLNYADAAANGANDCDVKLWISTNSVEPTIDDLYDIETLKPGDLSENECVIVGRGEYIYIQSTRGTASYRVDGVLDEDEVMAVGVLKQGNLDTAASVAVPNTMEGGTVSIHVLNRAASGQPDATVEVWVSNAASNPGNGDRIERTKLVANGGMLNRECLKVGIGEYIHLKSSTPGVNYRISHIFERKA